MRQTDQTLLEQMRITEFEIAHRKALLSLNDTDQQALRGFRPVIETRIDRLVARFYEMQTSVAEIALLIGDADTLARLQSAQRRYVLDLFSGVYDLEYVNRLLRIGLVHKRIGVEPKLYLSAIQTLKGLLVEVIFEVIPQTEPRFTLLSALDKLFMFDITLVFETYIRSLLSEIETSKEKSERYASVLEQKVRERTQQLEEMTRVDSLTGLQNTRSLDETLTRILRACQRRDEPVSIVYLDIDNFKGINDTHGHQRGDEVLRAVGQCLKQMSRMEDGCFRYGGDEFCIILPNCREEQAREMYLHRLNSEIKLRVGNVRLSVGIVQTGPGNYAEPDTLIRLADERMCAAKHAQKDDTVIDLPRSPILRTTG